MSPSVSAGCCRRWRVRCCRSPIAATARAFRRISSRCVRISWSPVRSSCRASRRPAPMTICSPAAMDAACMQQLDVSARELSPPPLQVIAVSGGKGGTGKTAVSVNLATAFARAGRRTMLLDGDLGLANGDVLLGLTPRCTLEHVLSGQRRLEEVILETSSGVRVVPASSGVARMAALTATEQAAIVRAFGTLHGSIDVLIVDTAAGIGESVLQFCQAAQQVLVVLRDEPTSLTDTYALIKVLSRGHGLRHFRVVTNLTRQPEEGQIAFRRLQRVTDRYLEVVLEYAGDI